MTTQEILIRANEAKTALTLADTARKNQALHRMADALEKPDHRGFWRRINVIWKPQKVPFPR